MNEKPLPSRRSNDEIDLMELFQRIFQKFGRFFTWMGETILRIFFFLIRKSLYLGLFIGGGVIIAYLLYSSSKKFYTSDMVLRSNAISNADLIAYINRLHNYSKETNYEILAQNLNLTEEEVHNIQDIQAFWIIDNNKDEIPDFVDYQDKHNIYDTTNIRMKDRFDIQVKTYEPQELNKLKTGIVAYLNENPLFIKENEIRLEQQKEMLAKTEAEIQELDSLQYYKYFIENQNTNPLKQSQMVFLNEKETKLFHNDILRLYQQKQELEKEIALFSDMVTVLEDFSTPSQEENSLMFYIKNWVLIMFFLGFFVVTLLHFRKDIVQTYKKY